MGSKWKCLWSLLANSQRDAKHLQLSLNSACSKSIQQVFILSFTCALFWKIIIMLPLTRREKNISVFPDCQEKHISSPDYCYNCWYLSTSATLHSFCKNLIWCFWTSYLPFNHLSIERNDKVRALRIWLISYNARVSVLRHRELKKKAAVRYTYLESWQALEILGNIFMAGC